MIQAVEADCTAAITVAGINCMNYMSGNLVPADAMLEHENTMNAFGAGFSPTICEVVNNFIGNVTGMWTITIDGAVTVIKGVKKAISNPKKLKQAIKKITNLAKALMEKIKKIVEFIMNAPNIVENYVLREYNEAIAAFQAKVDALSAQATAACNNKKASLLNTLNQRLSEETNENRRARLQASIDRITAINCSNVISYNMDTPFDWGEIPNLVFGLGNIISGIINSFGLKIPALIQRDPFLPSGQVSINTDGMQSKLDSVKTLVNSKIDMLQKMFDPYVKAYNIIAKFIKLLLSFNLKGILKWLLKLPKTIIKTWLDHAKFAMDLFKSIVQQKIDAVKSWVEEKSIRRPI